MTRRWCDGVPRCPLGEPEYRPATGATGLSATGATALSAQAQPGVLPQAKPGVIPIGPDPGRIKALQQALTAGRRQPQTAIEGLGQGAESIFNALMLKKERKKETARDQAFSDQGEAFMEALSGGLGSALRAAPRDRRATRTLPNI